MLARVPRHESLSLKQAYKEGGLTMTTLFNTLKSTLLGAALLAGFANSASAFEITNPLAVPGYEIELFDGPALSEANSKTPALPKTSKIAVARLDGGQMIPTPYGEEFDWTLLDKRSDMDVSLLSPSAYYKYIPATPLHDAETDNKIDEVRMAAALEGYSHVIVYGTGRDAFWNSFGSRALEHTGLTMDNDPTIWRKAKAKALLVNSFTGEVLGAASAENIEFNIGELADNVDLLMTRLSEA